MKRNDLNKSIEAYTSSTYEDFREYERFQFLIEKMKGALEESRSLLDIGCAKGELIYLLKDEHPDIQYAGLEFSRELIDLARQEEKLRNVEFFLGDAREFSLGKEYSITVMSGVLSIFDDIDIPLETMLRHTEPKGHGVIFGGFNRENIDVLVKFRNNFSGETAWESGWNMYSLQTITKILEPFVSSLDTYEFNIRRDIPKKENPVASYTVQTKEMGKLLLTGGNIVRDFHLLHYIKK